MREPRWGSAWPGWSRRPCPAPRATWSSSSGSAGVLRRPTRKSCGPWSRQVPRRYRRIRPLRRGRLRRRDRRGRRRRGGGLMREALLVTHTGRKDITEIARTVAGDLIAAGFRGAGRRRGGRRPRSARRRADHRPAGRRRCRDRLRARRRRDPAARRRTRPPLRSPAARHQPGQGRLPRGGGDRRPGQGDARRRRPFLHSGRTPHPRRRRAELVGASSPGRSR